LPRLTATPPDPDALANDALALVLGSGRGDAEVQIRRLRQRHPDMLATQTLSTFMTAP
jgi:hypothetical protein